MDMKKPVFFLHKNIGFEHMKRCIWTYRFISYIVHLRVAFKLIVLVPRIQAHRESALFAAEWPVAGQEGIAHLLRISVILA